MNKQKRTVLGFAVVGWAALALACAQQSAEAPASRAADVAAQSVAPAAPASTVSVPAVAVAPAAPAAAPAAAAELALSIYRQTAQGGQVRTEATYPFRSGDGVRIGVQPSRTGFLYLLVRGSSGKTSLLYPDQRIAGGVNRVHGGQEIVIPAEGWFTFDATPGVESVYALWAEQPDQVLFGNIEQATGYSGGAPNAGLQGQVLAALQARARDMTYTPPGGGSGAVTTGAAAAAAGAAGPVVVGGSGSLAAVLTLEHE
ncbi:MAG: DUF4384 domain-containing protein [Candidatus Schekmanbacteria bacterium]|nr:DUF4384 domain-containing protein [Candidatus Schekmanbacteria bacterium]